MTVAKDVYVPASWHGGRYLWRLGLVRGHRGRVVTPRSSLRAEEALSRQPSGVRLAVLTGTDDRSRMKFSKAFWNN